MKKSYVEVALTICKNILVEVEHEDYHHEDEIVDMAVDAAHEAVGDATGGIQYVCEGILDKKPCRENMDQYDEFVEVWWTKTPAISLLNSKL